MNLIDKLRKEKEFRQQCCRNSTKIGERNRKSWREKEEEFQQHCYRNSSTQIPARSCVLCARVWSAKKKKKSNLWQWHCRKWRKKKLNGIMAMSLPKMGGKKNCCCQNLGRNFKKSVTFITFSQHSQ